jgi:hypothetical protein
VVDQPQTRGRSDWEREYARFSEPIEQPIKSRLTQIAAGIGFQFSVVCTGTWIIRQTHGDLITEVTSLALPLYLAAMLLGLVILSAMVGGAVAGAWCVDWVTQGLAAGLGYLAVVALNILLFIPWSWLNELEFPPILVVVLAAVVVVRVGLTILGALLGNLLIRPIRVPVDAAR